MGHYTEVPGQIHPDVFTTFETFLVLNGELQAGSIATNPPARRETLVQRPVSPRLPRTLMIPIFFPGLSFITGAFLIGGHDV